ncbi:J domain-containing protein [Komagataeibacter oboediens]|uniref:J domain-containing protein n=1 Tax=Komagataeibacter oboediens TaxID=65958 RepID=UPI001904AC0B|nr:J domain-containing protein [Komagataeibacter oboediens]
MSDRFGFSFQNEYLVLVKDEVRIAVLKPFFIRNEDLDAIFTSFREQGFEHFNREFENFPRFLRANSSNEAIEEAKRIEGNEINKLKIKLNRLNDEISRLEDNKEFSFKKGEEYAVFGVRDNTPREDVKKIHNNMLKFLHPDNGTEKSEYLTKIINQAWDIIKRRK